MTDHFEKNHIFNPRRRSVYIHLWHCTPASYPKPSSGATGCSRFASRRCRPCSPPRRRPACRPRSSSRGTEGGWCKGLFRTFARAKRRLSRSFRCWKPRRKGRIFLWSLGCIACRLPPCESPFRQVRRQGGLGCSDGIFGIAVATSRRKHRVVR